MSVRNLTWQQVVVCIALIGGVVGAYKLFGELPAGVLLVLSGVINLLLGRKSTRRSQDDRANGKLMGACLLLFASCGAIEACGAANQDADLEELAANLSVCRAEGRDAGAYSAYERCKERNRLAPGTVRP